RRVLFRSGADDGCTACGACAKACPTGAIALENDDETQTFHLIHLPAACTGCDACLHLCDPDVLYSRGVPFFSALQSPEDETLASGHFVRCKRCKTRAVEGALNEQGLCELGAFRGADAFGPRIPERLRPLIQRQMAPGRAGRPAADADAEATADAVYLSAKEPNMAAPHPPVIGI